MIIRHRQKSAFIYCLYIEYIYYYTSQEKLMSLYFEHTNSLSEIFTANYAFEILSLISTN